MSKRFHYLNTWGPTVLSTKDETWMTGNVLLNDLSSKETCLEVQELNLCVKILSSCLVSLMFVGTPCRWHLFFLWILFIFFRSPRFQSHQVETYCSEIKPFDRYSYIKPSKPFENTKNFITKLIISEKMFLIMKCFF